MATSKPIIIEPVKHYYLATRDLNRELYLTTLEGDKFHITDNFDNAYLFSSLELANSVQNKINSNNRYKFTLRELTKRGDSE